MTLFQLLRITQTTLFDSRPSLLTNSFFTKSQLKPRIQMLYQSRTTNRVLWKYALVLPLLATSMGLTVSCERVDKLPVGKRGELWAVAGQVVDSQQKPISGVAVYAQTPTGSYKTNPQGAIERTGGQIKTDSEGRYQLYGLESADKVEFIHPGYLVTVLPLKRLLTIKQVPLITMVEILKLRDDRRAHELILETTKSKKP